MAVQPNTSEKVAPPYEANEKAAVGAGSDIESSHLSSPADYDDLPDPDAGKSDEERDRLVRRSTIDFFLHTC